MLDCISLFDTFNHILPAPVNKFLLEYWDIQFLLPISLIFISIICKFLFLVSIDHFNLRHILSDPVNLIPFEKTRCLFFAVNFISNICILCLFLNKAYSFFQWDNLPWFTITVAFAFSIWLIFLSLNFPKYGVGKSGLWLVLFHHFITIFVLRKNNFCLF